MLLRESPSPTTVRKHIQIGGESAELAENYQELNKLSAKLLLEHLKKLGYEHADVAVIQDNTQFPVKATLQLRQENGKVTGHIHTEMSGNTEGIKHFSIYQNAAVIRFYMEEYDSTLRIRWVYEQESDWLPRDSYTCSGDILPKYQPKDCLPMLYVPHYNNVSLKHVNPDGYLSFRTCKTPIETVHAEVYLLTAEGYQLTDTVLHDFSELRIRSHFRELTHYGENIEDHEDEENPHPVILILREPEGFSSGRIGLNKETWEYLSNHQPLNFRNRSEAPSSVFHYNYH